MKILYQMSGSFWRDESGVTSLEYVLLGSLIAVVIVFAVQGLGTQVCGRYKSIADALGATGVTCN